MKSLYDFVATDMSGSAFRFDSLKGKKVIVVNTASECGYTPQYAQLQELYAQFGPEELMIIGFPSNDFGQQEQGSDAEIADFCERNFGVSFPLMKRVSVLGENRHPFYEWISDKKLNGFADNEITWNFQKLLFDENGRFVKSVAPGSDPLGADIMNWLSQPQLF